MYRRSLCKKVLGIALSIVFLSEFLFGVTSCVVSSNESALTDVSITASQETITAEGSTTLTATPTMTGSATISYTWSITEGSEYAALESTSGSSVVLTGTNTSEDDQSVTVRVKATDGSNTKKGSITITVAGANSVGSVSIAAASLIQYNATAELTANATYTGAPTLTYSWEIASGSSYAAITYSGSTATLTAKNESEEEQSVTVKVTVTDQTSKSVSQSHTITLSAYGTEVKDELTGLSAQKAKSTISAEGSTTLTAKPAWSGELSLIQISYAWEIEEGSSYAAITYSGSTATLTAKNESEEEQSVTVKVTASDGKNVYEARVTVTVSMPTIDGDSVYLNLTDKKVSPNDKTWTSISTSAVQPITDVKVKFTEDDSGSSTGLIKVNAASFTGDLNVYVTGTLTEGGIKIQSNASGTVYVYLNGVSITSSDWPCLEVTKGSPTVVEISGTNTFTDGRNYGVGYGEEYSEISTNTFTDSSDDNKTKTKDATYFDSDGVSQYCTVSKSVVSEGSDSKGTLYAKGSLTIQGSGALSVTQAYKNCIATKATLTVNGGTYTLTSTGKNGLFADSSVVVNGGAITFKGTGSISQSEFRKSCGIKTDTDDSTSSVYLKGGTLSVTTYNGKGINSSKVYVSGGKNTFNVTGVTNYTNDSRTTISYYDADGVYWSNQSVNFAAEGIEGASIVEVSGGTTEITATDDGINVSDSSGEFYLKGGCLYTYAIKGDGIDSNGNIYIQDGFAVSYAPTGSEDSFDSGSKIYITGGTIAGTSGSQMALSEYSTSGQKMLYFTGSSSQGGPGGMGGGMSRPGQSASSSSSSSSFSKVAVYVSGTVKYAFTLPSSSFGLFVMSSPHFTSSSSSGYTVYTSPTFSGGSEFKGLYTTLPTVTAGSSSSTPSIK